MVHILSIFLVPLFVYNVIVAWSCVNVVSMVDEHESLEKLLEHWLKLDEKPWMLLMCYISITKVKPN
jgi:hypothetical protein